MEEIIGKVWHRFVSKLSNDRYPECAVTLTSMVSRLSIQYRALVTVSDTAVDEMALQILPATKSLWSAKTGFITRIAHVTEKVELASKTEESLRLPAEIAYFDSIELNQKLYLWLLLMLLEPKVSNDWFMDNQLRSVRLLQRYPGIKKIYSKLSQQHLHYRQSHVKSESETAIQQALLKPGSVVIDDIDPFTQMHVPLWLHPKQFYDESVEQQRKVNETTNQDKSASKKLSEKHRRKGEFVDDGDGRSGLIAFRLESLFSWSEFIKVDRTADDSDEDEAQNAADDMDTVSLSQSNDTAATVLKFDLDLPPQTNDDTVISEGILLPEWDFHKQQMKQEYCSLQIMQSKDSSSVCRPQHLYQQIRQIRSQFESLKPEKHWLKNQLDGSEIDLDNLIQYQVDVSRGQVTKTPGLYKKLENQIRDLSCLLLADLSLSTDTYINDEQRVIDVIKDALYLFSEALDATGDPFAISGFSSVKNTHVRYHQIKTFNEGLTDEVRGQINAIKPGYYTRMGAAIRQATQQLESQLSSQKLLLIVTDGKPNDIDQYEGRYGIEDTRHALLEARQQGLRTFCITIDEDANEYLPYLFGKAHYIVVNKGADLPKKLIQLYISLTQ